MLATVKKIIGVVLWVGSTKTDPRTKTTRTRLPFDYTKKDGSKEYGVDFKVRSVDGAEWQVTVFGELQARELLRGEVMDIEEDADGGPRTIWRKSRKPLMAGEHVQVTGEPGQREYKAEADNTKRNIKKGQQVIVPTLRVESIHRDLIRLAPPASDESDDWAAGSALPTAPRKRGRAA